jgi:hypothetical protein
MQSSIRGDRPRDGSKQRGLSRPVADEYGHHSALLREGGMRRFALARMDLENGKTPLAILVCPADRLSRPESDQRATDRAQD